MGPIEEVVMIYHVWCCASRVVTICAFMDVCVQIFAYKSEHTEVTLWHAEESVTRKASSESCKLRSPVTHFAIKPKRKTYLIWCPKDALLIQKACAWCSWGPHGSAAQTGVNGADHLPAMSHHWRQGVSLTKEKWIQGTLIIETHLYTAPSSELMWESITHGMRYDTSAQCNCVRALGRHDRTKLVAINVRAAT